MDRSSQVRRLRAAGAGNAEVDELLGYDEERFPPPDAALAATAPLPDEPFVDCWRGWAREAEAEGVFAVLRRVLPQLAFPIRAGMRGSDDYRAATLSGADPGDLAGATGLELERPDALELHLHSGFAGTVPLLVIRHRPDFVALVQALAKRNEPLPVPPAQGAVTIAGYNNWARLRAHRERWQATDPEDRETATWGEEFARIRPKKELYQDRFIILSDGPYSGVPARDVDLEDGLDDDSWREHSLVIRREHECAHYYTRRVFRLMRNHLLDELIADYVGLTAAFGRFRADLFLRFVGLEDHPRYRDGGRLDLYRGDPPLSDAAFRVLQQLVHDAARNLEAWDAAVHGERPRAPADQARSIRAMASLGLIELSAVDGAGRLERAWRAAGLGLSR